MEQTETAANKAKVPFQGRPAKTEKPRPVDKVELTVTSATNQPLPGGWLVQAGVPAGSYVNLITVYEDEVDGIINDYLRTDENQKEYDVCIEQFREKLEKFRVDKCAGDKERAIATFPESPESIYYTRNNGAGLKPLLSLEIGKTVPYVDEVAQKQAAEQAANNSAIEQMGRTIAKAIAGGKTAKG